MLSRRVVPFTVKALSKHHGGVVSQVKGLAQLIPSKTNGELFTKILIANRGEIVSILDLIS
jgi:hypothetical protein